MDASEFRTTYEDLIKRVAEYDSRDFNIFKVLRLERYEIRHSNFIQWLFGSDEFAKAFLKKFAEKANLGSAIADATIEKVERERSFNEVDSSGNEITRYKKSRAVYYRDKKGFYQIPKYDKTGKITITYLPDINESDFDEDHVTKVGRYIDINIITNTFTLTIENKVDTGEHSLQCVAYRNFMLNSSSSDYEGKDHYFVLLAREKPDDFDKGKRIESKEGDGRVTISRYPGYVYMDYGMIHDILVQDEVKKSFRSDRGQDLVVDQYAKMLDEWTNMPQELRDICEQIDSLEPFAETAQYDELMKSKELTEAEKRFADVARQYYLKLKKEYDDEIRPALEAISRDQYYIKDDYGRGGYAIAIPLKFADLDVAKYLTSKSELVTDDIRLSEEDYALLQKKSDDLKSEEKKRKEVIEDTKRKAKEKIGSEKDFKGKPAITTVDYRAPMAGYNNPSIAFIYGLKTDFSKTLCKQLASSESSLDELDKMKTSGNWDIAFTYCRGDGAGYTGGNKGYHCYADLAAVRKNTDLLNQKFIGQLYFDEVLKNDYLEYLCNLKEMQVIADYDESIHTSSDLKTKKGNNRLFSVSEFVEDILSYFLNDEERIEASLEAIKEILKTKMYQEDFERFLKEEKAHPIFVDSERDKILNNLKDLLEIQEISDDRLKTMQDAVKIALFNKWFGRGLSKPKCDDAVNAIIEALKKAKSLAELTNEHAKALALKFFDKNHKSGSKSSLYKDLKAKTYQVNKRITLCWHLVMVYCLNDDEIDKIDKTDDTDDTKKPMPKLKQALRSHTLEGAKVFGYDEWFETVVFKPEVSETEDSN